MTELKDQLSLLGRKTEYKQDYAPEVLEAFDNKHPGLKKNEVVKTVGRAERKKDERGAKQHNGSPELT